MRFASLLMAVLMALLPIADTPASGGAGVADAFQMEGVAGFIEGRAREVLKTAMSEKGTEWMAEAIAKVLNQSRDGKSKKTDWNKIFYQDAETRRLVEAELKEKIKEWLPGAVKGLIVQNVFAGIAGEEALEEAKSIADRVVKEMNTSFNDRVDEVVGGWYDGTVASIRNRVAGAGVPAWVDITDIKKTIGSAFDLGNIGDMVASQMGGIIGDAAVTGIRGRIEDALNGRLPREAVDAIKRGPEEFDKYVRQAEKYLPGNQLRALTNSILNRPLIKIPTPAYASMLAASAAGHFARAYDGVVVNPEEIKRGIEVTRVMIWQLQNKEWMNLSIMQIANIARNIAVNFDAGQAFDGAMSKIKEPIEKLQGRLDRLDKMIMKPIKDIQKEMKEITDELQKELLELQEKLVRPVRENIERIDKGLKEAGDLISSQIPDELNGIPENWEELKKRLHLDDGVLGKWGDKTPKELLEDAAKKLGLDKTGRKIKEDLSKLNDAIAGKIAKGAGGLLEAVHLLGPTAAILGIEKVPPKNESKSKELDPVILHSGEFESEVTDVVIPGRGIDFRFTRTYMSLGNFLGELGFGWTHSYAERLLPWNDGLTYIDEGGRKFFFKESEDAYAAPKGLYLKLSKIEGGYELQGNDGGRTQFDSSGRPTEKRDRWGNAIRYVYNDTGLLASIADAYGREIKFERRPDGLISALKDFAGRTFTYQYNDELELIGVRTPATPDFPKGKLTAYRYDAETNYHSMTMIMDPNGRVYLKNRYDAEGRVTAQSYGEGPWMTVIYDRGKEGETVAGRAWITDAMGTLRLYEQDEEGHLLNLWRWDGEKYHLLEQNLYDENGERIFPVERGDAFNRPNLTRSAAGQIVSETDERGEVTSYEYYPACDPDGDGVKIAGCTDTGGGYLKRLTSGEASKTFEYDPIGNITSVTDEAGNKSVYSVNALNQITKEEEGGLAPRSYFFDANDNLKKVAIDVQGKTVVHEFEYDILDRRISKKFEIEDGKYIETKYEYDFNGNLKRVMHPEGNTDDYEYDFEGRPLCLTRGSNSLECSRECVERNEDGEITALVDGEGYRTKFELNGFGEITGEIDPLGNRAEFGRNSAGRVTSRRDFDSAGKLLAESKFEYDAGGEMTIVKRRLWRDDPSKSSWVEERFGDEEKTTTGKEKGEDGELWQYSYDGMGNLISVTDPLGVQTVIDYDYIGRPLSIVRDAKGLRLRTHYEWNGNGLLAKVIDPNGNATSFAYDAMDRLVIERYADDSERKTAYDGRDLVSASIDRNGTILAIHYDPVGKITERNAIPADHVTDASRQRFTHDGLGRITEAIDEGNPADHGDDVKSQFVYDSLSRPVAEFLNGRWMEKEYDHRGDVVAEKYSSNKRYFFMRNQDGRETAILRNGKSIVSFEYDAAGQVTDQNMGPNLRLSIKRDERGFETDRRYENGQGAFLAGSLMVRDIVGSVQSEKYANGMERTFQRDSIQRLTGVVESQGRYYEDEPYHRIRAWKYEYDPAGNLKTSKEDRDLKSYTTNAVNEYMKITENFAGPDGEKSADDNEMAKVLSYDANGNLLSDGQREFQYDAYNRLKVVRRKGLPDINYSYDAFDRLVAEGPEGFVREYVWDGFRVIGEYYKKGHVADYVYTEESMSPVVAVTGEKNEYFFTDRIGSIIGLADAGGSVSSNCDYSPYGKPISSLFPPDGKELPQSAYLDCTFYNMPFYFGGHIYDHGAGLIYMRYRFFDPGLKRFITPDPIGYKLSTEADARLQEAPFLSYHAGQGLASRATYPDRPPEATREYDAYPFNRIFLSIGNNRPSEGEPNAYIFARNDPSMFTDPLGLASLIFDRSEEKLILMDGKGYEVTRYDATNFPTAGHKRAPNGTFDLGIPEFYSKKYRDEIYAKFKFGEAVKGESAVTGPWRDDVKREYSASMGKLKFGIGSAKDPKQRAVYNRLLRLHAGRKTYRKPTQGCIRLDNFEIEVLVANYIISRRHGDLITSITVQD